MSSLRFEELDTSGQITATYVVSPAQSTTQSNASSTVLSRIDIIPPKAAENASSATTLITRLLTPFLPSGYPQSVSPDYTPYQIYDSIQAFASTIAGLLASRAVLVGIGVGSEDASATAAMLLSIAQESIGRGATIFFAHYFALRIEGEVKFYRFLADIVNDLAFVLDCLSPSLPVWARLPALCAASACRAVCGVCGGSTKAILSAHFAQNGNIGELNAKDGSQETVVSLVGMWAGGLLVSMVSGQLATWLWLLGLLCCHLWANYKAVRSVKLRTLNRSRASIVLDRLLDRRRDINYDTIGQQEGLFINSRRMRDHESWRGSCAIVDMKQFLDNFGTNRNPTSASFVGVSFPLRQLTDLFVNEDYILWISPARSDCAIMLKENANNEIQIRAWCHATRLLRHISRNQVDKEFSMEAVLATIQSTLQSNQDEWAVVKQGLHEAGWNLSASELETSVTKRIRLRSE